MLSSLQYCVLWVPSCLLESLFFVLLLFFSVMSSLMLTCSSPYLLEKRCIRRLFFGCLLASRWRPLSLRCLLLWEVIWCYGLVFYGSLPSMLFLVGVSASAADRRSPIRASEVPRNFLHGVFNGMVCSIYYWIAGSKEFWIVSKIHLDFFWIVSLVYTVKGNNSITMR